MQSKYVPSDWTLRTVGPRWQPGGGGRSSHSPNGTDHRRGCQVAKATRRRQWEISVDNGCFHFESGLQ